MVLERGSKIYFMGIGGTGMAAVAGLCKEAGYEVVGSDKGVYPPMSLMLKELQINVHTPYASANITKENPDLVVIANALSRGNEEIEHVLNHNIPYTSFPKLLGDFFLAQKKAIVVAGTHGKTTTTSMIAHALTQLGEDPSYIIGGIPRGLSRSFALNNGALFAIEGDEYDTAFFDKGPKFLHYRPRYVVLNNLEFDHADIYKNVGEIEGQFAKLCQLVSEPQTIIANIDDDGVNRVLAETGITDKVIKVSTLGKNPGADLVVEKASGKAIEGGRQVWSGCINTKKWGRMEIRTTLSGRHNIANIAQIVGLFTSVHERGDIAASIGPAEIIKALGKFEGVRRRFDHLGTIKGIDIYEDFAHHPTAIRLVIDGFRRVFPSRRLVVAFEPANATGRRNILLQDFADSLALADMVLIGQCPVDNRIPENERMNTDTMQNAIGTKATAFLDNEELLEHVVRCVEPGDALIFMSSSSFSGVQYRAAEKLRTRFTDIA